MLTGYSHRRGGLIAVESLQQSGPAEVLARLDELQVNERVIISTCNRWDLVAVLPHGTPPDTVRTVLARGLDQLPYAYRGEAALEQLARVTASLDSLNPGEDQIAAQVREAFASTAADGASGPLTAFAFQTALRAAKRVRREAQLVTANTSLFNLARPEVDAVLTPGDGIAVLGVGHMGTQAARNLARVPRIVLHLVNRTAAKAEALSRELGAAGAGSGLSEFLAAPPPRLRVLVAAVSVAGLIDEAFMRRLPEVELIVDLGMPRNATLGVAASVRVLDVSGLQAAGERRRQELSSKLATAESIVTAEVEAASVEWTERVLGPSITRLRAQYLETIADAVPPEAAARLAHRFAHVPVSGLRALARSYGADAARLFLEEAGLT